MMMIDKDALLSDIERTIGESGCVNHEGEIMDCIRYASEVGAVPVVRGEWILNEDMKWACSSCEGLAIEHPNESDKRQAITTYCPNCGAKMDGGTP